MGARVNAAPPIFARTSVAVGLLSNRHSSFFSKSAATEVAQTDAPARSLPGRESDLRTTLRLRVEQRYSRASQRPPLRVCLSGSWCPHPCSSWSPACPKNDCPACLNSKPNCLFVGRSMRLQQYKQSPSFDHFDLGFPSKWLGDACKSVMQDLISLLHRRSNSGSLAKLTASRAT